MERQLHILFRSWLLHNDGGCFKCLLSTRISFTFDNILKIFWKLDSIWLACSPAHAFLFLFGKCGLENRLPFGEIRIRYYKVRFVYWWFAYEVIKNMILQIMINLPRFWKGLLDYTTCLCTKFEVVWINENRVMGQRSWTIFYYVIWENKLLAFFFLLTWLPQYKYFEIF